MCEPGESIPRQAADKTLTRNVASHTMMEQNELQRSPLQEAIHEGSMANSSGGLLSLNTGWL